MTKVAKTIKQFRTQINMTQDDLADRLCVSRQTISSWETGRTQPDLDMLEAMSSVFETSIEELIYGKKNRVGLEPESKKDKKSFVIVLSVIGSLMTAVGLVILFGYFWDKLEKYKMIFSAFPLLGGFIFSEYVMIKKRERATWTESAGVVWLIGMIVTNALINSIANAHMGFLSVLLIDVLTSIPIALITKAVVPFEFYLFGISVSITGMYIEGNITNILILFALLVAFLVLAFVIYKEYKALHIKKEIIKHSLIITTLMDITALICIINEEIFSDSEMIFSILFLLFGYSIFHYSSGERIHSFIPKAATGIYPAILSIVTAVIIMDKGARNEIARAYFIPVGIMLGLTMIGILVNHKIIKSDLLRLSIIISAVVMNVLLLSSMAIKNDNLVVIYLAVLCSLIEGILITLKGLKQGELFTSNVGMIMACIIVWIVIIFSDFSLIVKGFACSLTGIFLLFANYKFTKSINKEGAAEDD